MIILMSTGIFIVGALAGACLTTIFLTTLVPRGKFGQLDPPR